MKIKIETYFDPSGFYGGRRGCWRARLAERHEIHDAGVNSYEAAQAVVVTAGTHGLSDNPNDYEVVQL